LALPFGEQLTLAAAAGLETVQAAQGDRAVAETVLGLARAETPQQTQAEAAAGVLVLQKAATAEAASSL
jgi:hypothetical protein